MPVDACNELLAAIDARSALCVSRVSHGYVEQLMGFYRASDVTNPELFVQGLTALFCAFPEDLVRRVCDPVSGLPSRLKFPPTLADVREALDKEKAHRDRLVLTAQWTLREHERRRQEAEEEARFTPEHRAAMKEKLRALADELRGNIGAAE